MCRAFESLYKRTCPDSQLATSHTSHTLHIILCHEVNLGHLGLCLDRLRNGGCDMCTELLEPTINMLRPETNSTYS